jgi:hypothetical protein
MPTAKQELVELKVRTELSLQRKLERAARKSGLSVNKEMISRLQASFQEQPREQAQDWRGPMARMQATIDQLFDQPGTSTLLALLAAKVREQLSPAEIEARPPLKEILELSENAIKQLTARAGTRRVTVPDQD